MAGFRVHVVTLVSGGELDRQVGLVESAADDFEFSPVDIQLVLDYFDQAHASLLAMIDGLDPSDLARDVYAAYRGDSLNIGWILGHVLAEESQHLGQVAYIRGMIKGFNG